MSTIRGEGPFFRKQPNGKLGDIIIEHSKSKIQVGDAKEAEGSYPFFTSGEAILSWNEALVNDRVCLLNTGGNADVKFYAGALAYSTDTWCISGKNQLSDYLYMLLDTLRPELNQKFFLGTGLKHLQKPLLKERLVYLPTDRERDSFNEIAVPALSQISENTRENVALQGLRDWLLPLLMNGQATVTSEADKLSFCRIEVLSMAGQPGGTAVVLSFSGSVLKENQ